ncbi:MAG: F0F1 ATP synthase subunit delta [Clostridium sp.]|nr:MAG: F0F1 ATP synthase subunit delta [Clostridium sp.]
MIASEYANALYELALEDDKEDIIDSNLNDFC